MELKLNLLPYSIAVILVCLSQSLALIPANTQVHKGGYLKSNANTRVSKASHLRIKRQATGSRISYQEAQALVDKHNIRRRNETASDMEFMTWNDQLAALAQEWADRCWWGHGQPAWPADQLPYKQIGQNLYAYTGELSLERAMAAWSEEEKIYYNYDTLGCTQGQQCGHYTQIVWAKSTEVGCAYTLCPSLSNSGLGSSTYLVCNYGPAGNVIGAKPFKKGSACTQCTSGKGWCDNGLCRNDCVQQGPGCDCKIQCYNCGTVSNDCSCSCGEGFLGTDCKDRCTDNHVSCGANPGWPQSWCSHDTYGRGVTENCPVLCGTCIEFNQGLHGANENCPVTSSDPCFQYSAESLCSNNGRVQYLNNACVCQCNAGYKGTNCNAAVTDADIGVLLSLEIQANSWDSVWTTIRPKLVSDVTAYCTAYPEKCCDGATVATSGMTEYTVSLGEGYPYPSDGSNPISVLVYSKGTADNVCRNKELPAIVFYEIITKMEQSLNWTMTSCCRASLLKVREPQPMDDSSEEGGDGVPLWAYVLGGAVGFVFILIIIVIVVILVKRKKPQVNGSFYNRETGGSKDNLGYQKHEDHLRIYENVKI